MNLPKLVGPWRETCKVVNLLMCWKIHCGEGLPEAALRARAQVHSVYIRQACKSCDLQISTDKAGRTAIFKSLSGSRCKRGPHMLGTDVTKVVAPSTHRDK